MQMSYKDYHKKLGVILQKMDLIFSDEKPAEILKILIACISIMASDQADPESFFDEVRKNLEMQRAFIKKGTSYDNIVKNMLKK